MIHEWVQTDQKINNGNRLRGIEKKFSDKVGDKKFKDMKVLRDELKGSYNDLTVQFGIIFE